MHASSDDGSPSSAAMGSLQGHEQGLGYPLSESWPGARDIPPELGLSGIGLRAITHSDAPAWFDYLRLQEVTRHTSWSLQNEQDLRPQIDGYLAPATSHTLRLAITDKKTDRLIGTVGFNDIDLAHRRAEIAYDLAPAYWRRGIATRACEALVLWGGAQFGLHRIQATVLDTNMASAMVLEKCGFEREGKLRHYRVVRGEPRDFWIFSRLWVLP